MLNFLQEELEIGLSNVSIQYLSCIVHLFFNLNTLLSSKDGSKNFFHVYGSEYHDVIVCITTYVPFPSRFCVHRSIQQHRCITIPIVQMVVLDCWILLSWRWSFFIASTCRDGQTSLHRTCKLPKFVGINDVSKACKLCILKGNETPQPLQWGKPCPP